MLRMGPAKRETILLRLGQAQEGLREETTTMCRILISGDIL